MGIYGQMEVVPGSYTITASARGFLPRSFAVNVANGQVLQQDFALQPVPVIEVTGGTLSQDSCHDGFPEPGEFVTIDISLRNTGTLGTQNLVATLLETGGVFIAPPPQNYGAVPPGGPACNPAFLFPHIAPRPMRRCGYNDAASRRRQSRSRYRHVRTSNGQAKDRSFAKF
jgi:hypothetical protein